MVGTTMTAVRRAGRLASGAALAVAVLAALLVLAPAVCGWQRYAIVSGSMTGSYDRGTLVLAEPDLGTAACIVMIAAMMLREAGSVSTFTIGFDDAVEQTPPPTATELEVLGELHERTARAHESARRQ